MAFLRGRAARLAFGNGCASQFVDYFATLDLQLTREDEEAIYRGAY